SLRVVWHCLGSTKRVASVPISSTSSSSTVEYARKRFVYLATSNAIRARKIRPHAKRRIGRHLHLAARSGCGQQSLIANEVSRLSTDSRGRNRPPASTNTQRPNYMEKWA